MTDHEVRWNRTRWMREERFGMFIHWGLYAIPARGEWVRSTERISVEDYEQYFEEFDPVCYDPKKWAKLARQAGMKYAVLTTKHHDGFCLFDSAYTDYKATNTKAGRDLVREYVDAFRAEGIKVGFYYSLLDWHHPDYPHYGDRQHPMRENPAYGNEKRNFSNYVTYLHNQVRELMTNYGKIDLLWFDFSYQELYGEAWRGTELVQMIRSLQPEIIINDRLSGDASVHDALKAEQLPAYAGDFQSPEQIIPLDGVRDGKGNPVTWEACMTLNDHWGYAVFDHNYKPAKTVIRMLTDCVSKGGNLLLNVGPTAKGEIPKESVQILEEIGAWMRENGESIYGCGPAGLPRPAWGCYTRKGDFLYAHVYDVFTNMLVLEGLADKVAYARMEADGAELSLERPWNSAKFPNDLFVNLGQVRLPDAIDTVVKLKLK